MSVEGDQVQDAAAPSGSGPWWRRNLRTIVGVVALICVAAAIALVVNRDRAEFLDAVGSIGWAAIALSMLFGAGAVVGTYGTWTACLTGLGVRLPLSSGVPVFFVSQLGKYLPGSVWPVLAQMEAGARVGAPRRTMLSANLFAILLGITVGSVIACIALPLGSPDALRTFWWLFLALPFLLTVLHPKVLPGLFNRVFALLGRPPLPATLSGRDVLRAALFSVVSWVLFGAHIAAICIGLGVSGPSAVLLSIAAMAVAVSVGILLIPFPAGAGGREAGLLLVLSPILTRSEGLAVALVSRVALIAVDVMLAGCAALVGPVLLRRAQRSRTNPAEPAPTQSPIPTQPPTPPQEGTNR